MKQKLGIGEGGGMKGKEPPPRNAGDKRSTVKTKLAAGSATLSMNELIAMPMRPRGRDRVSLLRAHVTSLKQKPTKLLGPWWCTDLSFFKACGRGNHERAVRLY